MVMAQTGARGFISDGEQGIAVGNRVTPIAGAGCVVGQGRVRQLRREGIT